MAILLNPELTLSTIEGAISNAKSHVHLDYYIWRPDDTDQRLRDLLVRLARSGVEVRVLVDDVGSRSADRRFWNPLFEAGGQASRFLRVNPVARWLFSTTTTEITARSRSSMELSHL